MGTITVNVDDSIERLFRERVYASRGRGKGVLGEAFNEALTDWAAKQQHVERCMQLLREGIDLGGVSYGKREELHPRR